MVEIHSFFFKWNLFLFTPSDSFKNTTFDFTPSDSSEKCNFYLFALSDSFKPATFVSSHHLTSCQLLLDRLSTWVQCLPHLMMIEVNPISLKLSRFSEKKLCSSEIPKFHNWVKRLSTFKIFQNSNIISEGSRHPKDIVISQHYHVSHLPILLPLCLHFHVGGF